MIDFGKWLLKTLKKEKMTQRDLAWKTGVSECSVSKWVNGERSPTINTVQDLLYEMHYHIEFVKDNADE